MTKSFFKAEELTENNLEEITKTLNAVLLQDSQITERQEFVDVLEKISNVTLSLNSTVRYIFVF